MSARRVVLTSLGAGLVVGAAAPMASAATIADETPLPSTDAITSSAPIASSDALTSSVPLASTGLTSSAPIASTGALTSSAPVSSSAAFDSTATATKLANSALSLSTAALSGANANWSHLGRMKLYPLAGSGIDPLSNMVATDLGGIPVSTAPVSQMMSDGLPIADLPVVGAIFGTAQD